MMTTSALQTMIREHFRRANIPIHAIEIKSFPGELIAIVEVDRNYEQALKLAHELDSQIEDGFITVRKAAPSSTSANYVPLKSVHDDRIDKLLELLSSRARTSESQPSLRYVEDAAQRVDLAVAPRHHLVFGRRGVGKTALLLEAKRKLSLQGVMTLWVNMHPMRSLDKEVAFLTIASRVCDLAIAVTQSTATPSLPTDLFPQLRDCITEDLSQGPPYQQRTGTLVPRIQQALSKLCSITQQSLFIFLDDIHYLRATEVPGLLDLLHGISRDNPVWLKIAGIQHQTRWFTPQTSTGLQTGHDASIINLDITLEQPARARKFLKDILIGYVEESSTTPLRRFLGGPAIDRLVLAAGGVPRDFLSLCASAIQIARQRSNARTVGVQDVNNAAGSAAQTKLHELEDDAAAARGGSEALLTALNIVRKFLLDEHQITFMRVDFLDKEAHSDEYASIQALMDLRMLHLVNSSLSDSHHAGHRSEVYLLDLSQYSGSRLKQKLRVLDFVRDHLVLKRTRSDQPPRVGDTPRRLVELLRRGPVFGLDLLTGTVEPKAIDT